MKIEDLEIQNNTQELYDSFNSFMMSPDKKVFNKLVARTLLCNIVKDVPGDIVECGVFKGTGLYTFLKLKNVLNANSLKKVIGFDFFNTHDLLSSIEGQDKEAMSTLFKGRDFDHSKTFREQFENNLISNGFSKDDFILVEGDISGTSRNFVEENPGFKISLLYMDLDLAKPTYETLCHLWDRVSKGGIVVFDEYAHHKWSESLGVDRFIEERNLEIKNLDYFCPTAYIKK